MNSPNPNTTDYGIRMVDSKIEENRPTYGGSGLTDSRHSSQSGQNASYQVGVTGTLGSKIETSTVNVQKTSTYGQSGLNNTTYQSGTYQYGSNSGQIGNSGMYSSTTSR